MKQVLTPCQQLDTAIVLVQELMAGESATSINSRERSVQYQATTLEQAVANLRRLIGQRLFANCPNAYIARGLTGMSAKRAPGYLPHKTEPDPCGCTPPKEEC